MMKIISLIVDENWQAYEAFFYIEYQDIFKITFDVDICQKDP